MQKTLMPEELASSPASADQASTLNEMGVICYLQGDTEYVLVHCCLSVAYLLFDADA
jgi:hypothetical protein